MAFLVALVFGVFVLGAVSDHLNRDSPEQLNVYTASIVLTALAQQVAFIMGIAFFTAFLWKNF